MKIKMQFIILCFVVIFTGCSTTIRSTIPPYNPPILGENKATLTIPDFITLQSMDGIDFWEDGSLISNTTIEVPSGSHTFLCSFKKKITNKVYVKKNIELTYSIEPNVVYKIVYYLRPLNKDTFDIEILIESDK